MCGIVGIFAYRDTASNVDRAELRRMRDHMARRGPDGAGEWYGDDQRVALGHRRLAIIDLSTRALQPMATSDAQLHITFNGEIYNYRALRGELERKGYTFQTSSDTEVLLQLYRERGVAMLQALRGMYAFALWDSRSRSLLLARDPYGIKPLYYAERRGTLRFASQVKALLAGGGVSREPSSAGDIGFHLWGCVPEPHTSHAEIRALPAGTHMIVRAGHVSEPKPHFSLAQCWADAEHTLVRPDAAAERVSAALRESVAHHLVADVPVSVFLSAGIDSGALAGLMSESGGTTHAITLAFSEFQGRADDEGPEAAMVARQYGLTHHVRRVAEHEFASDLPAILTAMDQPTIDGVNTWFVSKATAELGLKVAVSGLGGDELFGGYPSFEQVPRLARLLRWPARVPLLGRSLRRLAVGSLPLTAAAHPKLPGGLEYGGTLTGAYWLKRGLFMPWELPSLLPPDWVRDGLAKLAPAAQLTALLTPAPRSPWAQVAVLEGSSYMRNQLLRDTDWASMAHSLEVRVPLVDHVLLSQLAPSLVHARDVAGKRWLANSPHHALPRAVQRRSKTGFSTPIAAWLERAPELDAWRGQPALRTKHCPWARRYAWAVARTFRATTG